MTVVITPPEVGDPTELDGFAIPVIDAINDLGSALGSVKTNTLLNGSFEESTGANVAPTSWSLALSAGDSCAVETTAANVRHGAHSFRMVNPGGALGGVSLTSADFYAIGEAQTLFLGWFMKSTAAGVRNQVLISWYDAAQSLLSTSTLYDSVTNSTVWVHLGGSAAAPAGARFFKVTLVGVNNNIAGTVWFDGCEFAINITKLQIYNVAGSYTWISPITGTIEVEEWGGGAGAAGSSGVSIGKDAGSGAYQKYWISVVAGTTYTIVIGAAGTGGAAGTTNSGVAGGDTYFGSVTNIAKGGSPGTLAAFGAGGVAQANVFGQAGNAGSAAGAFPPFLVGTPGRPSTGNAAGGLHPAGPDGAGGNGSPGLMILKVLG